MKNAGLFYYSAGVFFLITAIAKLISSFGDARILQSPDPILGLQFSRLMFGVGLLELAIAAVCLFSKSQALQTILVTWLTTSFLAYRLALWWIGWHRPCPCLGNLTDALHVPPQTADMAMKIILAYLLIGSYATLFYLWRQRQKTIPVPAPN